MAARRQRFTVALNVNFRDKGPLKNFPHKKYCVLSSFLYEMTIFVNLVALCYSAKFVIDYKLSCVMLLYKVCD